MNKKSKNKNRSKPSNPTPVTEKPTEPALITEEVTVISEEEKPLSLEKESDCVIEIKSEQIELSGEGNELAMDMPKKPKRNKGKKKKNEDENGNENKLVPAEDLAPAPPPVVDTEVKEKAEYIAKTTETKVEDENKNEEENITATVRKKKNKKKQNEPQKVEEPVQEVIVAEESVNIVENINVSVNKQDINSPDFLEPGMKQPKKKNKKKKHRNDSEKSDKADEVLTCTAAFQELITSTDNDGEIKSGQNIENPKETGEVNKELASLVKEETLKDLIQSVLLPEESKQSEDEVLSHDPSNELKNKKKSKKDKKQPQPKRNFDETEQMEEPTIQQLQSTFSVEITQEIPAIQQTESLLEDKVPKSKAKIAKPVEKKRKGKTESSESHENKTEDTNILDGHTVKETISETEKFKENVCSDNILPGTNVQITGDTTIAQNIGENEPTLTIDDKSSKNRNLSDIANLSTEAPTVKNILDLADVNLGMKSNKEILETSVSIPDPVLLTTETLENTSNKSSFSLEVSEEKDKGLSEPYKTVEKKKKKHPKKLDVPGGKSFDNKAMGTPEPVSVPKEETLLKQQDNVIIDADIPSADTPGEVEISSLKTDDIDGASDTTPDFIHHPLSLSQQFSDRNNNMIICEITSTDEKINIPLQISTEPIIQDSGNTPEPVEKKLSVECPSVLVVREKSLTNEPEKTDLKSKMMEVSQDMEELRLSIERSLAELTSMEKDEEKVEKRLEEKESPKLETIKLDNPKLEEPTFAIKDEKVIESKTLCEKVGEPIIQESPSKSEAFIEIIPPTPEKPEIIPPTPEKPEIIPPTTEKTLPEKIQEKNVEAPAQEQSDDHKTADVKETQPQVPARKDHKGKGKGKRKGKQEQQSQQTTSVSATTAASGSESSTKEVKKEEKEQNQQKSQSSESNQNKGKQQQQAMLADCNGSGEVLNNPPSDVSDLSFEPIEHFEDALTSSVDDVNKTFEMIASEVNNTPEVTLQNPQINVIAPAEDTDTAKPKQNPVSPPKNLLGHPDIPVPSNRTDYKKEKNKPPNMCQAKVKIKDAVDVEKPEKIKQSKESQTESKEKTINNKNVLESFSYMTNETADYVYKYSFRKVFLQSLCQVCRKELSQRVPCQFCSLVFYCSQKHKDEDWPQHQSLCFAVCTIVHLKEQKHIYADAKNITGQNYRLLRMQMIISCEKVLKRKLMPWEQEALLYPRICADIACREWRQNKLADCDGCGQISYCSEHPEHMPSSHQRWCRSYALYQKLVHHQQTRGRLEPKLPTRLLHERYTIPEKINEVLAALYDEKIDMTDVEYAALTQLATAPLTAAFCHQLAAATYTNGLSKKSCAVVHQVGAELQFEADSLHKWELFFLHLQPVQELRVVLVSPDLNPSNLPLDLLAKVKLCDTCKAQNRRIIFSFQDKKSYYEYWTSDEFCTPDVVCAFNPSIQRSSMYNGKDTWPTTVSCILKLKVPFVISSYSINELNRDIARIKDFSELAGIEFKTISAPKNNPFASVRPDRNFITDDEIPLLFKNYFFSVLCGV